MLFFHLFEPTDTFLKCIPDLSILLFILGQFCGVVSGGMWKCYAGYHKNLVKIAVISVAVTCISFMVSTGMSCSSHHY